MMTNIDLENMADRLELPLVGVYSKDELVSGNNPRQIGNYIINMQSSSDGNGTHWVCATVFRNGKALYFDSFGFPSPIAIQEFLQPFKPYAYNNRDIQDYNSDNCGRFCMACCALVKEYDDYGDFLEMWSNDKKQNDKIVHKIINDLLNK